MNNSDDMIASLFGKQEQQGEKGFLPISSEKGGGWPARYQIGTSNCPRRTPRPLPRSTLRTLGSSRLHVGPAVRAALAV